MNKPRKYVSPLKEEQTIELNKIIKDSEKPRYRKHAHVILLSAQA